VSSKAGVLTHPESGAVHVEIRPYGGDPWSCSLPLVGRQVWEVLGLLRNEKGPRGAPEIGKDPVTVFASGSVATPCRRVWAGWKLVVYPLAVGVAPVDLVVTYLDGVTLVPDWCRPRPELVGLPVSIATQVLLRKPGFPRILDTVHVDGEPVSMGSVATLLRPGQRLELTDP